MYGPMRLAGLASGMDIEQMVNDLMKVQRLKTDRLYQDKQVLQWQQESYRSINALMLSFRNLAFDMRLQGTFMKNTVTISDASAAEVTARIEAREGSYTLKVNAIAKQAEAKSGSGISRAITGTVFGGMTIIGPTNNRFVIDLDGTEKTITIRDGEYSIEDITQELQFQADKAFGEGRIEVGMDGERVTLQPKGEYRPQLTLKSVAGNDGLFALGFKNGDTFKVNPNASLRSMMDKFAANPLGGDDGIIEFQINGQFFSYDLSANGTDRNKTLNGILNDINENERVNVTAYYDALTDKVIIQSKDYGAGANVSIENLKGNLFGNNGTLQIASGETYGRNSEINLNGVTIYKDSNKFTIENLIFDLKDTSENTIKIEVSRDTESAFDAIKNFVEEYNKLIETINGKLYEDRFKDYAPLTEEQKRVLSEREAELWEEKAKSGLLRNDSMLDAIVSNMRTVLYQEVKGTGSLYSTLASIGITTGDYKEMGKLHIDENRLKEALKNDLEGVVSLFGQSDEVDGRKGIAIRLHEAAGIGINRLSEKAGIAAGLTTYDNSFIGDRLRDIDKRIYSLEEQLIRVEDRYWRQFTAMEKALDQMNSQSLWLTQQLMFWSN